MNIANIKEGFRQHRIANAKKARPYIKQIDAKAAETAKVVDSFISSAVNKAKPTVESATKKAMEIIDSGKQRIGIDNKTTANSDVFESPLSRFARRNSVDMAETPKYEKNGSTGLIFKEVPAIADESEQILKETGVSVVEAKPVSDALNNLDEAAKELGDDAANAAKGLSKSTKGILAVAAALVVALGGFFAYKKHSQTDAEQKQDNK